ncbi:hypothetical protein ACOQFV_24140 [Nocardiopsis changdeensis]|uniref:Uncharacterized protein n=1 Tax=Nocardiopsis changdeensis TaxID=2831969 RepID=A0A975QCP3_9ACTN|nr:MULTISPECIES: hypothetical protein [Nocardiopsis]QUX26515.1 hypothetical protein KGD84_32985 [Nocardiopsis changdeensis]QYX40787.1 hypothetical protein K1J57_32835 [Nocardiopsis sp. MT53]
METVPIRMNGILVAAPVEGADQVPQDALPVEGYRDEDGDEEYYTEAEREERITVGYVWMLPDSPAEETGRDQWMAWSPVIGVVAPQTQEPGHPGRYFAREAVKAAYGLRYLDEELTAAVCAVVDAGSSAPVALQEHSEGLYALATYGSLVLKDPTGPAYTGHARYSPTPFAQRLVQAYRAVTG